jgi:hypothetical protein
MTCPHPVFRQGHFVQNEYTTTRLESSIPITYKRAHMTEDWIIAIVAVTTAAARIRRVRIPCIWRFMVIVPVWY